MASAPGGEPNCITPVSSTTPTAGKTSDHTALRARPNTQTSTAAAYAPSTAYAACMYCTQYRPPTTAPPTSAVIHDTIIRTVPTPNEVVSSTVRRAHAISSSVTTM